MAKPIEIVKQFFEEIWNDRKFHIADDIFTNDFITGSIGLDPANWEANHGNGPESMKHHIKWWLQIIPDAKMTINHMAGSNNEVITIWELNGTMKEALFGIQATNKSLRISGATISLFEGEKIKLNKTQVDLLGLFQQIGLLPRTTELLKK